MAKTIVVHVKQVIDDEVLIDSDHTYCSEEEFEKAREEAINNWKDMQGDAAEIESFDDIDDIGTCLEMSVDGSDDREEWNIIDQSYPWNKVKSISDAIKLAGSIVREAKAKNQEIPYIDIGNDFCFMLPDLGYEEIGKQLAALDK